MNRFLVYLLSFLIVVSTVEAKGGGFSSGGRSFSSGSRSSSSRSSSSSPSKSSSSTPSKSSSVQSTPSKPSAPPTKSVSNSRPGTSYRSASGAQATMPAKGSKSYLSQGYTTPRSTRAETTFGPLRNNYYSYPSYYTHSYMDGINMWFWIWLLSNNNHDTQVKYIYMHENEIDSSRVAEYRKNNPEASKQLDSLKSSNTPKELDYCPPGIDKDLQYNDDLIEKKSYFWPITSLILVIGAAIAFVFFLRRKNI